MNKNHIRGPCGLCSAQESSRHFTGSDMRHVGQEVSSRVARAWTSEVRNEGRCIISVWQSSKARGGTQN